MRGTIAPLHQYVFMAWCSVKTQGQLYIYLYLHSFKYSQYQKVSKNVVNRFTDYVFLVASESELTSVTTKPFRHFGRNPWTGIGPSQGFSPSTYEINHATEECGRT